MRTRLLNSADPQLLARWYAVLLAAACFGWPLVLGMPAGWPRFAWLLVAVILIGWSAWSARAAAETSGQLKLPAGKPPWILFLIAGAFFAVIIVFPTTFFGDEDLIALPSLIVASRIARILTWPGLTLLTLIGLSGIVYGAHRLRDWHVLLFAALVLIASASLAVVHLHPEMLMVRYPPLVHFVQFAATAFTGGSLEFLRLQNAFWVVALGFVGWYAASDWPPAARLAAALALCLTPLGWTYHILLYQACGELTIGLLAVFLIAGLLKEKKGHDTGRALLTGIVLSLWILYRPTSLALVVIVILLLLVFNRRRSAWIIANVALPIGAIWVSVYLFGSFQYSFFSPEEPRSFPIVAPLLETMIDLHNQLSIAGLVILLAGGAYSLWKRPQDRYLLLVAWLLALAYTGLHEIITVPTWYGYGRFNVLLMLPLGVTVGSVAAGFRWSSAAAVALLLPLVLSTPWSTIAFLQSYRSLDHFSRIERTVTGGVSPAPLSRAVGEFIDQADTLILLSPAPSFLDLLIAQGKLTVAQRTAIIQRAKTWTPASENRPVIVQAPAIGSTYRPNIPDAEEKRLLEAAEWARKQPNVQRYRLGSEETLVVP